MSGTTIDVGNEADLNNAIQQYDTATSGSITINITQDIILGTSGVGGLPLDLDALNNSSGVTLVIEGNSHTLDGDGHDRGFLVYAGNVSIDNLTIDNAAAVGGNGGTRGGGGAGLGGGLFVASGGTVAIDNVTFSSDSATGGNGGSGGPV